MKVVINACFGGFGLSTEAMLRLIEMKSDAVETKSLKKYSGFSSMEAYQKDNSYRTFKDVGNGFVKSGFTEDVLYKDNTVYSLKDKYGDDQGIRAHKDLIKIVEEMGDKANGECAELKIVEIPDGIHWVIEEYDGSESVEEAHQSWS